MRKMIIPRKDFYTMNLKEGYKIKHRPSELSVVSYGVIIGTYRSVECGESKFDDWNWEGTIVEQEAWKQMKEKLSEHYNCEIVIK